MKTVEAWVGPPVKESHEVEIDRQTVVAFWRLGRALAAGTERDREVFTLGRCIGSTPGITAMLHAYGERDDPSSFPISRLMYGGDQPMLDAYWQSLADPVVFNLARQVHARSPEGFDRPGAPAEDEGGVLVFDVSGEQARLVGLRFQVPS